MVITSPFAFLKMKLEQRLCHHKRVMYKGNIVVCQRCGKIILMSIIAILFFINGFSQTAGNIKVQPGMNDLINMRPTKKDSLFVIKMLEKKSSDKNDIHQMDSSEIFSSGDSVFIVHYFYISDSMHPYRVGGGYVGKTNDFQKIMGGKSKLKFKNK